MMMDRRHAEDPLLRPFIIRHLDDDGKHFDDEHAADEDQQQFPAFVTMATAARIAQRQRTVSPMKIFAGCR